MCDHISMAFPRRTNHLMYNCLNIFILIYYLKHYRFLSEESDWIMLSCARHSSSKLDFALTRSSFQRTVTVGNMRDTAEIISANVVKAGRKDKLV